MFTRRDALLSTLFGAGYVGLRALATGLPVSFLLNPRRALADVPADGGACPAAAKAQFIILCTSGNGDPINPNVPGMFDANDANGQPLTIAHSKDPSMKATPITMAGTASIAAAPWATLPQAVLDRTVFWHLMTNTPVHPKEPQVLKLMDATKSDEMFPSVLAKVLAPCLGTIQAQPISIGAASPSEGLSFEGQALPIVPALALKATLTNPVGMLTTLQPLRDQTLNQMYDLYKNGATTAQRAYIDSMVTSQTQVRNIKQALLSQLGGITDNSPASQVLAAVTLIQMKVTPVIAIHLPFGADNHRDIGLAQETSDTVASLGTLVTLMSLLASANLADQVSVVSLNVFGRTVGPGNTDGRQHNPNHQVSFTIGKPFKGGIIGGVAQVAGDYGAVAFDSKTGKPSTSGDVSPLNSLASFGQTVLAAVGADAPTIAAEITSGTVVTGALA